MHVRSLGLSTDLQLLALRGTILDRDDYLVVITPDDPGYYYGNLLVFPAPPQVGEVGYWTRRFADEIGGRPDIHHVTFAWDGTTGDVGARDELEAAGFAIQVIETMTAPARRVATPIADGSPAEGVADRGISIRELDPDTVHATADLAFAHAERHDDSYRRFLHRRALWQSRLIALGSGRFWGAFDGDVLVGSLGLVSLGDVARYQDVQTAEDYRRRGIATALLATAAQAVAETAETVVIQVLPDTPAARVYERVGFCAVERQASACRHPPG